MIMKAINIHWAQCLFTGLISEPACWPGSSSQVWQSPSGNTSWTSIHHTGKTGSSLPQLAYCPTL